MKITITQAMIDMAGDTTEDSPVAIAIRAVTGHPVRINTDHMLLGIDTPEKFVPPNATSNTRAVSDKETSEWWVMPTPRPILDAWLDWLAGESRPQTIEF